MQEVLDVAALVLLTGMLLLPVWSALCLLWRRNLRRRLSNYEPARRIKQALAASGYPPVVVAEPCQPPVGAAAAVTFAAAATTAAVVATTGGGAGKGTGKGAPGGGKGKKAGGMKSVSGGLRSRSQPVTPHEANSVMTKDFIPVAGLQRGLSTDATALAEAVTEVAACDNAGAVADAFGPKSVAGTLLSTTSDQSSRHANKQGRARIPAAAAATTPDSATAADNGETTSGNSGDASARSIERTFSNSSTVSTGSSSFRGSSLNSRAGSGNLSRAGSSLSSRSASMPLPVTLERLDAEVEVIGKIAKEISSQKEATVEGTYGVEVAAAGINEEALEGADVTSAAAKEAVEEPVVVAAAVHDNMSAAKVKRSKEKEAVIAAAPKKGEPGLQGEKGGKGGKRSKGAAAAVTAGATAALAEPAAASAAAPPAAPAKAPAEIKVLRVSPGGLTKTLGTLKSPPGLPQKGKGAPQQQQHASAMQQQQQYMSPPGLTRPDGQSAAAGGAGGMPMRSGSGRVGGFAAAVAAPSTPPAAAVSMRGGVVGAGAQGSAAGGAEVGSPAAGMGKLAWRQRNAGGEGRGTSGNVASIGKGGIGSGNGAVPIREYSSQQKQMRPASNGDSDACAWSGSGVPGSWVLRRGSESDGVLRKQLAVGADKEQRDGSPAGSISNDVSLDRDQSDQQQQQKLMGAWGLILPIPAPTKGAAPALEPQGSDSSTSSSGGGAGDVGSRVGSGRTKLEAFSRPLPRLMLNQHSSQSLASSNSGTSEAAGEGLSSGAWRTGPQGGDSGTSMSAAAANLADQGVLAGAGGSATGGEDHQVHMQLHKAASAASALDPAWSFSSSRFSMSHSASSTPIASSEGGSQHQRMLSGCSSLLSSGGSGMLAAAGNEEGSGRKLGQLVEDQKCETGEKKLGGRSGAAHASGALANAYVEAMAQNIQSNGSEKGQGGAQGGVEQQDGEKEASNGSSGLAPNSGVLPELAAMLEQLKGQPQLQQLLLNQPDLLGATAGKGDAKPPGLAHLNAGSSSNSAASPSNFSPLAQMNLQAGLQQQQQPQKVFGKIMTAVSMGVGAGSGTFTSPQQVQLIPVSAVQQQQQQLQGGLRGPMAGFVAQQLSPVGIQQQGASSPPSNAVLTNWQLQQQQQGGQGVRQVVLSPAQEQQLRMLQLFQQQQQQQQQQQHVAAGGRLVVVGSPATAGTGLQLLAQQQQQGQRILLSPGGGELAPGQVIVLKQQGATLQQQQLLFGAHAQLQAQQLQQQQPQHLAARNNLLQQNIALAAARMGVAPGQQVLQQAPAVQTVQQQQQQLLLMQNQHIVAQQLARQQAAQQQQQLQLLQQLQQQQQQQVQLMSMMPTSGGALASGNFGTQGLGQVTLMPPASGALEGQASPNGIWQQVMQSLSSPGAAADAPAAGWVATSAAFSPAGNPSGNSGTLGSAPSEAERMAAELEELLGMVRFGDAAPFPPSPAAPLLSACQACHCQLGICWTYILICRAMISYSSTLRAGSQKYYLPH